MTKTHICIGQPDIAFVNLVSDCHKGTILSHNGASTVAYLHKGYPVISTDATTSLATICHHDCHFLISKDSPCCPSCAQYRNNLRSLLSRYQRREMAPVSTPKPGNNVRFMNTPQLCASRAAMRRALNIYHKKMKRLNLKLEEISKTAGVDVDDDLHSDILQVVEAGHKNLDSHDDFSRAFWKQQV